MIKLFYNVQNVIVNELINNNEIVDNINDATIVAVFYTKNIVKFVEMLLSKYKDIKILIEMIPYNFNSKRVFMLNTKMRDMCIRIFNNNIYGLDISHVDISLVHDKISLRSEVMNALSLVGVIMGWDNYRDNLKLRFSYNDDNVHVSGYARGINFTLSIFISLSSNEFHETIKVYTKNDGIFTLDNDIHTHSYSERYGAAIQNVINDIIENNYYYQENLNLIVSHCTLTNKYVSRNNTNRAFNSRC